MRHGDKVNNLGRKSSHRKAMMSNMAASLILHKRIETTTAKAKALRTYIEPIITRSKDNTTHNRRSAFSYLQNKEAAKELFEVVGPKIGDRPGGYTRIIKLGARLGDAAEVSIIELVDFNEVYTTDKKAATSTSKKKRTRRGGSKDKAEAAAETKPVAPVKAQKEEEVAEPQVEETNDTIVDEVQEVNETENTDEQPKE